MKSDVFISVTSVEDNHLATSSDDHLSTSDDEVLIKKSGKKHLWDLHIASADCLFSVLLWNLHVVPAHNFLKSTVTIALVLA